MGRHGWRGTPGRAERYGNEHQRLRREWAPVVALGRVTCDICGERIMPGQRWHLGHEDDGVSYRGPQHAPCNLRAASALAHARRWGADPDPEPRTRWLKGLDRPV